MGTSHQTLLEQLRITSREISRRKEYFGFSEHHAKLLHTVLPAIHDNVGDIVDRFYQHILSFDEIDRLIGDAETLTKLRNHQRLYILSLFQGDYDEEYVHSRLRIGLVHKRIGVEPRYYVSAVQNLGDILKEFVISQSDQNSPECTELVSALDKILHFDLTLIFDTYIHSLMDEIRRSKDELEKYTESLEHIINDRTRLLKQQARMDGLTGLINQSHFYEELRRELSRGQRRGHTTSLLYCDLDGFKALNDTHGHRMGDTVLKEVAQALRQSIRTGEMIARYGGDEFCIIVPEGGLEEAQALATRIIDIMREQIAKHGITCSIGISASAPGQPYDAAGLVKQADSAMYRAKQMNGFAICIDEKAQLATDDNP